MVCYYHFKSNNKYIEYLDDLFETKRINNNQIIKLISPINQILITLKQNNMRHCCSFTAGPAERLARFLKVMSAEAVGKCKQVIL